MSIGIGSAGSPIEHSYNQPGTYEVNLVVTNACGCSDKYAMYVNVDEFQGIQIECPAVVCDGDEVEYTVDNPSCSQASWTVDGGQITSQSSQYVKVIWDDVDELGFGDVTYINECEPCAGKTTVKIPVITDNAAIQGPTNVCPNSVYYYSMPQWPSTKFQWSLSGDATFLNSEQPNVLSVLTGNSGSFTIISEPCNGLVDCAARDSITVNISPQAFINGSQESCIDRSFTPLRVNTISTVPAQILAY